MGKWYRLNNILKCNAHYNLIFGERSNGKTFSVLEYMVKQYYNKGEQSALVRRWRDDFIGKRGQATFESLVSTETIKRITNDEWDSVHYYSSRWYLAKHDEEGNITKDETPFCFGFSITTQEHDKSTSYPRVTTILFDEFITRKGYCQDEFVLFMNLLSTIIRDRDNVTIFMLGNTVNKYCPYFAEFGLKHVDKMKQGAIDVYTYGSSKLKVAVEYTKPNTQGKKSDLYFAFDNPKLNMITNGVWELDIYPHCPYKYKPKEVFFKYFIQFDTNILQADMIYTKEGKFTFIHEKTTPLQNKPTDLIFGTHASHKINERSTLLAPRTDIEREIIDHYNKDIVFYSDNNIGDVVKNYIDWCLQNKRH